LQSNIAHHELQQQHSSNSNINQRQLLHTPLNSSLTSTRQLKADDKTYRSTHTGQQHHSSKAAKGTKLHKSSKSKSGKSSYTKSSKTYHSKSAKGYTTDVLLSLDTINHTDSIDSPSLNELILDENMLDDTTTESDDTVGEDGDESGVDVESANNEEEEDAQGQDDGLSSLDDMWLTDDVTDEDNNFPSPTPNNITPFPTDNSTPEPAPTPNLEPAKFDIDCGPTTSYSPTSSKGLETKPPYTLEQRKTIIQQKCKSTIHSRSNSLLHLIGNIVSNPEQSLVSQTGPLYNAFVWLVHYDDAILCPPSVRLVEGGGVEIRTLEIMRIKQRYMMAALYYSLNGDGWSNCSADRHLFTDQDGDKEVGECLNEDGSDGIRFLDYRHECTWFGISCDATPKIFDWHEYIDVDVYHAVTEISLPDNNLVGELPIELYRELDTLQVLDMERNRISGSLSDDVGRLKDLQVLKL